jgi:hypothetical protein
MPARMTRSAPQSPFELPEVRAVVRATRLSGESRLKQSELTVVPVPVLDAPPRTSTLQRKKRWLRSVMLPVRRIARASCLRNSIHGREVGCLADDAASFLMGSASPDSLGPMALYSMHRKGNGARRWR